MSKFNSIKNQPYININLGVPFQVGLYVPAFFIPKKIETKKSSTAIPHARIRLRTKLKIQRHFQKILSIRVTKIKRFKILIISPICN